MDQDFVKWYSTRYGVPPTQYDWYITRGLWAWAKKQPQKSHRGDRRNQVVNRHIMKKMAAQSLA